MSDEIVCVTQDSREVEDLILKEYFDLIEMRKFIESEIENKRFVLLSRGNFLTKNYVCVVEKREEIRSSDAKSLIEYFGLEKAFELGLIKKVKSTRVTVRKNNE